MLNSTHAQVEFTTSVHCERSLSLCTAQTILQFDKDSVLSSFWF